MAHDREKGGEFCENKSAPMIRECPDCVEAYVIRVEEFEAAAHEIQAQNYQLRHALEILKRQRDRYIVALRKMFVEGAGDPCVCGVCYVCIAREALRE
jgi:hypothetical protein